MSGPPREVKIMNPTINKQLTEEKITDLIMKSEGEANDLAMATIQFASQYLTKDEHLQMAGWLISSARDFPDP